MLTPAQQSTLDYHLRETNLLTNEELILELTDHYTTALLDRMAEGMTFETALTATQKAFGGRKGLQKMERQYNRVTFRQYDVHWLQALRNPFKKPLIWRQTVPFFSVLLFCALLILMQGPITNTKWASFAEGMLHGLLGGILIGILSMLWPYVKAIFRHGFHNIPTQVLYLVKRQTVFTTILCVIGIGGFVWVMPVLPSPVQALLVSLYLGSLCLYALTAHIMRELLYDYETSW